MFRNSSYSSLKYDMIYDILVLGKSGNLAHFFNYKQYAYVK
jgi:hypothetical protein